MADGSECAQDASRDERDSAACHGRTAARPCSLARCNSTAAPAGVCNARSACPANLLARPAPPRLQATHLDNPNARPPPNTAPRTHHHPLIRKADEPWRLEVRARGFRHRFPSQSRIVCTCPRGETLAGNLRASVRGACATGTITRRRVRRKLAVLVLWLPFVDRPGRQASFEAREKKNPPLGPRRVLTPSARLSVCLENARRRCGVWYLSTS